MAQLKLTANTPSEQRILEYLQNNASKTLAEKINNGTPFEKDGKPLTNKKSLSGFMKYACDEARKLAAKNETAACVKDSVVYGWAIHYFEEDSIEGTLYTLDGSEYIPEKKSAHVSGQTAKTSVASATTPAVSTPPDEPTPEELQEALEETANEPEPAQIALGKVSAFNLTSFISEIQLSVKGVQCGAKISNSVLSAVIPSGSHSFTLTVCGKFP